jgi:hypothetical protein
MVNPSALLAAAFVAIALLLAAGFVAAVYVSSTRAGSERGRAGRSAAMAAAFAAAWLAATGGLAASGRLSFATMPPTIGLLIVVALVLTVRTGLSPLGERLAAGLPLAALVGAQAFRLPLELAMHRAYAEGLMPVQMSFSGRNFDIVTGTTAIIVAALLAAGIAGRRTVLAWNVMGMLLLANVVVIAILSTPTPLRVFHNEPANVWITRAPFVWLPAVMVPAALLGHILIFRRLRRDALAAARTSAASETAPAREEEGRLARA